MHNLEKKIEYSIIKMIIDELDIFIDHKLNIKYTKEDNLILVELGFKLNYELLFDSMFNVEFIDYNSYNFLLNTNIETIIDGDLEELFVNRYKKYLQTNEKMLLYLCVDKGNDYLYNEYKESLSNIIKNINS